MNEEMFDSNLQKKLVNGRMRICKNRIENRIYKWFPRLKDWPEHHYFSGPYIWNNVFPKLVVTGDLHISILDGPPRRIMKSSDENVDTIYVNYTKGFRVHVNKNSTNNYIRFNPPILEDIQIPYIYQGRLHISRAMVDAMRDEMSYEEWASQPIERVF